MDEIKADLDHGVADCVAADLALLEHLLARHAAFDAYCQALEAEPELTR
jgi:hypothetical protein